MVPYSGTAFYCFEANKALCMRHFSSWACYEEKKSDDEVLLVSTLTCTCDDLSPNVRIVVGADDTRQTGVRRPGRGRRTDRLVSPGCCQKKNATRHDGLACKKVRVGS
jgi:hypothetical protein